MSHSDSVSEKYSMSSVIIGIAIWIIGVWISSNGELLNDLNFSVYKLFFLIFLILGFLVSLKSTNESLNTFKVLGIILNWGMLLSLTLLYLTN